MTKKKIPSFENTGEALAFGRAATLQQREGLLKMRRHYLAVSDRAIASGDCQEALDAAVEGQFCREAWKAGETKK